MQEGRAVARPYEMRQSIKSHELPNQVRSEVKLFEHGAYNEHSKRGESVLAV